MNFVGSAKKKIFLTILNERNKIFQSFSVIILYKKIRRSNINK